MRTTAPLGVDTATSGIEIDAAATPRALLVFAHPDDEVIALGARLGRYANGLLVHVTDGAPRNEEDSRGGNLQLAWAGASNVLEWFVTFERLQHERWQASGKRGVLADERVVQWHREALPGLAKAGLLRMYALRLDGEIIAMLYALVDPPERRERTLYVYLPAFSMRHAELRPGTLMLAFAAEQAADEGVQTVALLRGNEPYKQMRHAKAIATHGVEFAPLRQQSPSELAAA